MQRVLCCKAWLETRSRFFTGLAATVAVCAFWTLGHSWVVNQWHRDAIAHPEWKNPAWLLRAIDDYPFFIHHFVFADMFQKIWVVTAVLLGIGGLMREASNGTVGFTLSLPVSRARLFITRLTVALLELCALCATAVLLLGILSALMGLDYPITHALWYSVLITTGGLVFLAGSLLVTELVEGDYTPVLISLGGVGLIYFVMQPYLDGLAVPWVLTPLAIPKLMAGKPDIVSASDVNLAGLAASLAVASAFIGYALKRTRQHDY
jgi:hypothetical protein